MTGQHAGRRAGRRRAGLSGWLAVWLAAWAVGPAVEAGGGPQLPQVLRGRAIICHGAGVTSIYATNNSIIRYSSFDIAPNETVRFYLPSSSSRVLNRIDSSTPSQIDGVIWSNGRVYFANPAGLIFGPTAVVDAAAVFAAAGKLSDRDFARGRDRFREVYGPVVNQGTIRARTACLVGRTVTNGGAIVAEEGLVVLAAGNDVYVGPAGGHVFAKVPAAPLGPVRFPAAGRGPAIASPLGAGDVYSIVAQSGSSVQARKISLAAGQGDVMVAGRLDATGPAGRKGGEIRVEGERIELRGATIDASGPAGGGRVQIGGSSSSGGAWAPVAAKVYVSGDSTIRADATDAGDGGRVVVVARDLAVVEGRLSARGGPSGGNGGMVETSGGWLHVTCPADTSAPAGAGGTWLLDPYDIQIVDGPPGPVPSPSDDGWLTFLSGPGTSQISFDTIKAALNLGQRVEVRTSPGGTGRGNITWLATGDPIEPSELGVDPDKGGHRTLMLIAHNDVIFQSLPNVRIPDAGGEASGPKDSLRLVVVPDCDRNGHGRMVIDLQTPRPPDDDGMDKVAEAFQHPWVIHSGWFDWRRPLPADPPRSAFQVMVLLGRPSGLSPGAVDGIARPETRLSDLLTSQDLQRALDEAGYQDGGGADNVAGKREPSTRPSGVGPTIGAADKAGLPAFRLARWVWAPPPIPSGEPRR